MTGTPYADSPYRDLDRPPLHAAGLRSALITNDGLWRAIEVKAQTGSTNADVAQAALDGAAEGLVVIAERQDAGRGRLGRQWESPPRAGLAFSVLLRPAAQIPVSRYGWLPLLAGVALAETVRRLGAVDAVLKWPNDLLIGERKCAGILAESIPEGCGRARPEAGCGGGEHASAYAVVVGIGLNVSMREAELPVPQATSLALAGSACTDRDPLLRGVLRELAGWYRRWTGACGDPASSGLAEAYRLHCGTLGRQVTVTLPNRAVLSGEASDVDSDGRLVVRDASGELTAVSAGDVHHVSTTARHR